MADENLAVDLFGEPVRLPQEGPGRPPIEWDRAMSNRVLLCFVRGWTLKRTAKHVGISVPTLRKVFFSECAKRTSAAERIEMRQLELLVDQAEEGNVGAIKELGARLEKLRMRDQHQAEAPKPKAKARPMGKKEAAQRAAEESTGLYDPPSPPTVN